MIAISKLFNMYLKENPHIETYLMYKEEMFITVYYVI